MSTQSIAPPPKRSAAPPSTGPAPVVSAEGRFAVVSGPIDGAQRIMVYGPGGIGKSSLAALAPNPVVLDVEGGTRRLNVARISDGLDTWEGLRACLQSNALDGFGTVVIDSVTRAEELAVAHTLATVKNDKGSTVKSVEGYGFGKGLQYVYDTFLHLMQDMDRHVRCGRNVVLVAHDCASKAPNPHGEDWLRYEPRLQQTKGGGGSIRNRVFEWCDHVLFIGYDVAVTEDGRGKGAGTRTIYTVETPTQKAKHRDTPGVTIPESVPFASRDDGAIWPMLLGGAR